MKAFYKLEGVDDIKESNVKYLFDGKVYFTDGGWNYENDCFFSKEQCIAFHKMLEKTDVDVNSIMNKSIYLTPLNLLSVTNTEVFSKINLEVFNNNTNFLNISTGIQNIGIEPTNNGIHVFWYDNSCVRHIIKCLNINTEIRNISYVGWTYSLSLTNSDFQKYIKV